MRDAMATAEVGDDVFGEDPTIAQLEAEAATFLGKESALFVPSGTMANQIAIHVHCRPGDELICEERSHVYFYEGGSVARLSGTQVRTIRAPSGFPTPDDVRAAVRPDSQKHTLCSAPSAARCTSALSCCSSRVRSSVAPQRTTSCAMCSSKHRFSSALAQGTTALRMLRHSEL
jgi:threonine aldolase